MSATSIQRSWTPKAALAFLVPTTLALGVCFMVFANACTDIWTSGVETGTSASPSIQLLALTALAFVGAVFGTLLTNGSVASMKSHSRVWLSVSTFRANLGRIIAASLGFPLILMASFMGGYALVPGVVLVIVNQNFYKSSRQPKP